jgi:hypothetical protein
VSEGSQLRRLGAGFVVAYALGLTIPPSLLLRADQAGMAVDVAVRISDKTPSRRRRWWPWLLLGLLAGGWALLRGQSWWWW